jgi:TRAP-type C4-dicarboxylate transport system substrate-binding protein
LLIALRLGRASIAGRAEPSITVAARSFLGIEHELRCFGQSRRFGSLQIPASNPIMGRGVVLFKEQVEKETEGAIHLEIFDSGKLYNDEQVVGAVQSGAIEMGAAVISQISKRLPAADIMEQPFLFNFETLTRAALSPESELRQLIDKAVLETIGVHVLWWQNAGTQVLLSKGVDMAEPSCPKDCSPNLWNTSAIASCTRRLGSFSIRSSSVFK